MFKKGLRIRNPSSIRSFGDVSMGKRRDLSFEGSAAVVRRVVYGGSRASGGFRRAEAVFLRGRAQAVIRGEVARYAGAEDGSTLLRFSVKALLGARV